VSHKRPFASKVQYLVSVLGEDGKPLPYFPSWQQDAHPFWTKENKVRGTLKNVRILLQSADAWTKPGGAKERLLALESMAQMQEEGRPLPPLRLPDTAHAITVRAQGIAPDGLVWGKWVIQHQPVREVSASIPEDWQPTPELRAWVEEIAQIKGVPGGFDWGYIMDYALQPWRLDLYWPHADWFYDWQYKRDGEGKKLPRVVPSGFYLRWRERAPFAEDTLECDAFSIALASQWLAEHRDAESLPEDLIMHIHGSSLEYVNAAMVTAQYLGRGR